MKEIISNQNDPDWQQHTAGNKEKVEATRNILIAMNKLQQEDRAIYMPTGSQSSDKPLQFTSKLGARRQGRY